MALTLRSTPRISAAQFARVLQRYGSPCTPIADECYSIIAQSGLDPAIALAVFGHESRFGTQGIAVEIKNWGNVRAPFKPERASGKHPRNFAIYPSWQESLRDWCDRINQRYIRERGLDTVEKAIPVYAPSLDGNKPQEYIAKVNSLVGEWMAEDARLRSAVPSAGKNTVLRDGLVQATFASVGASFRPESPMHQFVLSEARAGRPLGSPLGEMKRVTINGQEYVVQVFALDTLYSPVQRLNEVYRLSALPV